ncbi:hypothetical protein BJF83_11790 [Nocardiopsis sp. CNR-923]|uniref:hypothetical protein n=1 Tax=Nocardiopsis sp. CNR-923 TaxID=1904965 RepID=UPI0009685D63|nr:hypothetical protein [Nocardiopsis sp. CNR-923]OLT29409.1 hypothetical protein BJF83_11790 [Nocardiopsis sp. CNR-923]
MTRVCDIRELSTVSELRAWASAHGARVRHLGPDLENRPVYGATRGHVTRVARGPRPDRYSHALVWHSPLETPEATHE